jgi:hypothetical protein
MATRRNEIFRDHHATLRTADPPTADPAALKPRNRIDSAVVRKTEPRPPVSDAARHDMITRAAHYRAQLRGFAPGEELDDWLAAERDVEWFLAGGSPPQGLEKI